MEGKGTLADGTTGQIDCAVHCSDAAAAWLREAAAGGRDGWSNAANPNQWKPAGQVLWTVESYFVVLAGAGGGTMA